MKVPYVMTTWSQVDLALKILGRNRKRAEGPLTLNDISAIRAFIQWARATNFFAPGASIDLPSFPTLAEVEGWAIREDGGADVIRVAAVLEGLVWVDWKMFPQAVVIWPAPPIGTDKSRELKEQSPNGTVEPVSQTNPSTTETKIP